MSRARGESFTIEAIDPAQPDQIHTYITEKEIPGGLSVVYLAQRQPDGGENDECMFERVALKIAEREHERELLVREAETLLAIHARKRPHSRIVRLGSDGRVLEERVSQGRRARAVLELEYLDGGTLKDWFERWRRPGTGAAPIDPWHTLETAVDLVGQIAEALVELADLDQRVIHRDIKPQNIMYTGTGLRLFDFNVARRDDDEPKTEYVGSVHYMAPEVRIGRDYDHRADLYSLGVILHELLMRAPFENPSPPNADQFELPWDDAPLAELPKELRERVRALVCGLLIDRARRLGSASEVKAQLDDIAELLRAHRRAALDDALAGRDLIQLVAELRPSGQHAVVADSRESSRAERGPHEKRRTRRADSEMTSPGSGQLERLMRQRLRVHDPLEGWLIERIRAAAAAPERPTLIILAGNAGDGKSYLIDRLIRTHLRDEPNLEERVLCVADATHADAPTRSQEECLRDFFAPFADGASVQPSQPVSLIAMNTGMVIRFFEAPHRADDGAGERLDFGPLYGAVQVQLGLLRGLAPALPFDLEVVNLDLRDLLLRGPDDKSFFERMLDRVDPGRPHGLLHELWQGCERCEARPRCPVHFNLTALTTPNVRRAVTNVVERAALDPEVHLSPRLLWGFIYRMATGGLERYQMEADDDGPCDVVRRRIEDAAWLMDGHFSEVLFAAEGRPDTPFWHALGRVDPAFSAAPELDRMHTRLSLQRYRDDSGEELRTLGGSDDELCGLRLRDLLSNADIPAPKRRNAAVRRRVFFHPDSLAAFSAWGTHGDFRHLLDAYARHSARAELSDKHKQDLSDLANMIADVFVRGSGRTIDRRQFLRVSQPHPQSQSQLLVEVERKAFEKIFRLQAMLRPDAHIAAHAERGGLLEQLGYRPHMVTLSLRGNRLLVDLALYEFLLQVRDGRQPSHRDLAQFEALLFIGEQIGNHLAHSGDAAVPLHVFDEDSGALYQLFLDDFGELALDREQP
ncbi:serine/threonine-protein kinase [Haliangium sp.]|uniref:serine/threonine-protein kinase n=1 Tax=Haliangium sp. TaxID=2663208 RepID=UPI003D0D292A